MYSRISKEAWLAEGTTLFGPDFMLWRFVCPSCGHVQTVSDFKRFKDKGADPDSARFNCIGRYNGHLHTPMFAKDGGPCNYTAGGLLNISPVCVFDEDGKEFSCFAFDDDKKKPVNPAG